jgi:hypothetical protein
MKYIIILFGLSIELNPHFMALIKPQNDQAYQTFCGKAARCSTRKPNPETLHRFAWINEQPKPPTHSTWSKKSVQGLWQVFAQVPAAGGVPEFTQCFCLNLADPFPCDVKISADFFERVVFTVDQAKTKLEHLAFAIG